MTRDEKFYVLVRDMRKMQQRHKVVKSDGSHARCKKAEEAVDTFIAIASQPVKESAQNFRLLVEKIRQLQKSISVASGQDKRDMLDVCLHKLDQWIANVEGFRNTTTEPTLF